MMRLSEQLRLDHRDYRHKPSPTSMGFRVPTQERIPVGLAEFGFCSLIFCKYTIYENFKSVTDRNVDITPQNIRLHAEPSDHTQRNYRLPGLTSPLSRKTVLHLAQKNRGCPS